MPILSVVKMAPVESSSSLPTPPQDDAYSATSLDDDSRQVLQLLLLLDLQILKPADKKKFPYGGIAAGGAKPPAPQRGQSTGNRQTAFNDLFAAMNISHRGLHTKTWQGYVKTKLTPAATRAAETLTIECVRSVRQLYSQLNFGNPGNVAVSYDGFWMTRGHSSHIGVGAVIELFTGLVLDYVVLSNFCAGCQRGPKVGDSSYEE
ncbi:hypothetical protein HPB49_016268 [Dermacentor silvarum]|uniref:Uncharacterized protein n=1 Tax=Dermacentor silvarum TaxID=543639 RepID=A0ACB8D621_DERSI|nr:hypothetical protein HPB49_016268 [Dermacentor silvarum]